MKTTHLHLEHVAVGYNGKALLRDIGIGVDRGEIITLIGPNGSGKSTILKTITRQLTPVDGELLLAEGHKRKKLEQFTPGELARRMAVVLTGRLQTELMTCRDVAAMGRYPYTGRLGILSASDEQKVEEALAAVNALHLSERQFDAVSDGERQRILLARAICQEPEIIVLDEPTSFLDIRHKLELLSILHTMSRKQGITVVMSLHEIDLAMKISDRVICVRGENIFACGKPSEVLDDETVRRLYDLDPALGSFDTRTGSLQLHFAQQEPPPAQKQEDRKQETQKQEDHKQESYKQETQKQEDHKQESHKQETQKQQVQKQEDHKQEAQKQQDQKQEKESEEPFAAFPRLMIAAPRSGSGKTLITCGLLRLLQKKDLTPAAFKCGPDYIDPMFHRTVLQIPSRNLDTFFLPAETEIQPAGGCSAAAKSEDRAAGDCSVPVEPEDQAAGDCSVPAKPVNPTRGKSADTRSRACVREILAHTMQLHGAGIALIEGVMGYYDGTGASGMQASSRELALQTQTPVVLVVDAKGMSRSIVPLLQGLAAYEKDEQRIRGVILNRIPAGMFPRMKKWIEQDTDLQVIGYVPQDDRIRWESRHLGLFQPEEIGGLQQQVDHLAGIMEETIDLKAFLALARSAPPLKVTGPGFSRSRETAAPARCQETAEPDLSRETAAPARCQETAEPDLSRETAAPARCPETAGPDHSSKDTSKGHQAVPRPAVERDAGGAVRRNLPTGPRIAVARDEAFSFYYEDNLELLRECGAELVFFSPLHDRAIPAADGLLLGGGYPELHAQALADNESIKEQIRERAADGMPILAECGGFMYLQEYLEIEDPAGKKTCLPMCGVLPGVCRKTDHLVRFGYLELQNRSGEPAPDPEPDGGKPVQIPETGRDEKTCQNAGKSGADAAAGYLRNGHGIRGHEFHYFESTENGDAYTAYKPGQRSAWNCMVVKGNITAGFPHLYYRSDPAFAAGFTDRCRQYRETVNAADTLACKCAAHSKAF